MATEIISIGLLLDRQRALSVALWAVGGALYVTLWAAYVARAVLWRSRLWADLIDPARAFGFFTLVAGSEVLGTRSLLGHLPGVALALGIVGSALWLGLMYLVLIALVLREPSTPWRAVNGAWLIAIVGVQSIAAFAAAAIAPVGAAAGLLALSAFTSWSIGILLYVVFITLIMARLFFHPVHPADMQPPYWINMGATAISALAGSRLLLVARPVAFLVAVRPFVEGLTVMIWAWGSWWVPFLVIVGIWKYVLAREPIRYHPSQWSVVFPLGMYGVATRTFSGITGLGGLRDLGVAFVWIALAAWLALCGAFAAGALGGRRRLAPK